MQKRNAILALMVLMGLGALGWWMLDSDEAVVEREVDEDLGSPADLDEWIFDDSAPARQDRPERASGGARQTKRERFVPDPNDPQWEARRQRGREQWRSRVDIAPLGENAPDIDPDAIGEALRDKRPALRECIEESGGWRAMREARAAAREPRDDPPTEGERRRRGGRVVFDVRPDGTVDRETLEMDPPMPEPFSECFTDFFGSLELEGAGDGARVELPTRGGGGGRGGRGAFSGDAGTQNRRSRTPR